MLCLKSRIPVLTGLRVFDSTGSVSETSQLPGEVRSLKAGTASQSGVNRPAVICETLCGAGAVQMREAVLLTSGLPLSVLGLPDGVLTYTLHFFVPILTSPRQGNAAGFLVKNYFLPLPNTCFYICNRIMVPCSQY